MRTRHYRSEKPHLLTLLSAHPGIRPCCSFLPLGIQPCYALSLTSEQCYALLAPQPLGRRRTPALSEQYRTPSASAHASLDVVTPRTQTPVVHSPAFHALAQHSSDPSGLTHPDSALRELLPAGSPAGATLCRTPSCSSPHRPSDTHRSLGHQDSTRSEHARTPGRLRPSSLAHSRSRTTLAWIPRRPLLPPGYPTVVPPCKPSNSLTPTGRGPPWNAVVISD